MSDPKPTSEPAAYQVWFLSLVYGTPALLFGLQFLPAFPIENPQTALSLIPKLASNAGCLNGLMSADSINAYLVTYANSAFWLGLLGLGLGVTCEPALKLRLATKESTKTGASMVVWPAAAYPADEARRRPAEGGGRLAPIVLALTVALGFPWWIAFHSSACWSLSHGLPLYRAFHGNLTALASELFFFVSGILLAGLCRYIRGSFQSKRL